MGGAEACRNAVWSRRSNTSGTRNGSISAGRSRRRYGSSGRRVDGPPVLVDQLAGMGELIVEAGERSLESLDRPLDLIGHLLEVPGDGVRDTGSDLVEAADLGAGPVEGPIRLTTIGGDNQLQALLGHCVCSSPVLVVRVG